jgi:hypothetical protein
MGATTVEVSTNHVAMVSHPDAVLQLIKTAAEAVPAATVIEGDRKTSSRSGRGHASVVEDGGQ